MVGLRREPLPDEQLHAIEVRAIAASDALVLVQEVQRLHAAVSCGQLFIWSLLRAHGPEACPCMDCHNARAWLLSTGGADLVGQQLPGVRVGAQPGAAALSS